MELTDQQNKKIHIMVVGIVLFILIVVIMCLVNRKIDTTNASHGIIIEDNVSFKINIFQHLTLSKGDRVNIISHDILKNQYQVEFKDKIGTVDSSTVEFYQWNEKEKNSLMIDVSQFDREKEFTTQNDFTFFLLEHPINYVYIRLGGRGWGKEGNWYYDTMPDMYIDVCEYLGVPYGFYFVDEAIDEEEILDEAVKVKEFVQEKSTSMNLLPVAIDLEYQEGKGRTDKMWEERIPLLKLLMQELRKQKIECIIYVNGNRGNQYLYKLDEKFWVARYPEEDNIPESSYSQYLQLNEMKRFLKGILAEDGTIKISADGKKFQSEYHEEFLNNIIGWQFSPNGANKDGIEEPMDLSIVQNQFFKEYVL